MKFSQYLLAPHVSSGDLRAHVDKWSKVGAAVAICCSLACAGYAVVTVGAHNMWVSNRKKDSEKDRATGCKARIYSNPVLSLRQIGMTEAVCHVTKCGLLGFHAGVSGTAVASLFSLAVWSCAPLGAMCCSMLAAVPYVSLGRLLLPPPRYYLETRPGTEVRVVTLEQLVTAEDLQESTDAATEDTVPEPSSTSQNS